MLAVLTTLVLFAAWWLIGMAGFHLLRADLRDARVALTAPIFGSALTVLPLFTLSNFGLPMRIGGPPIAGVLVVAGAVVVARRRPQVALAALPVIALCVADLGLVGRPMFEFGFHWIANANGDMGYYVLSATELMDHGLRSAIDVQALAHNRDFPTASQGLNLAGLRPGTQITLGAVAAVWNRQPLDVYMPMALAANMCAICAVGALTMQAAKRWWGATVAAALLVASPLWAYGLMQQLLPQVWGVGLAVGLFAWLMRAGIHRYPARLFPDLVVIAALAAALFIVYFEVAVSLVVAYLLYVFLLAARRGTSIRALAVLWGVPIAATLAITNVWLPRAIGYLHVVVSFGTSGGSSKGLPLFGYAVVPTALVGLAGLRQIYAAPGDAHMSATVAVAALLLVGALAACVATVARGAAAGVAMLGDVLIGVLLARNNNQFGLFKLYMYIQPFVAATIAVWLCSLKSRRILVASAVLLAAVFGVQVTTLTSYVNNSVSPIDLRYASANDVLPKFRETIEHATKPVVTATDNFTLVELQAAIANKRPLYYLSRNLFTRTWQERTLLIPAPTHPVKLRFEENTAATKVLNGGNCLISLPTGSEVAINRRSLPEGSPAFEVLDCKTQSHRLAFITSRLGQPATLPLYRRAVSFWQLESDAAFPGRTFSAFGRYALFQIIGPTPKYVRVALEVTSTPISDSLPPAAVTGEGRVLFPITGSGSARVVSPPIRPAVVGGRAYLVMDMGRNAALLHVPRPGLTGLWGNSIPLDPRALTSYVRDVSLISDSAYRTLRPPSAIRLFPAELSNPNLEYSGIYEDGWVSDDSYVVLPSGIQRVLVIHADALPLPHQRVDLLMDGKSIASRFVSGGALDWNVRLPSSLHRRRVELRWARTTHISLGDPRMATAQLFFLGFALAPTVIEHFPADLRRGLIYSGIYEDGWLARVSRVTLAGGRAGHLVIRADVPENQGQRLLALVDGRTVTARAVPPGLLTLRVPIPASSSTRRVELVWTQTEKLAAPDTRRASVRLELLEVE
jgi:hypothetical protein